MLIAVQNHPSHDLFGHHAGEQRGGDASGFFGDVSGVEHRSTLASSVVATQAVFFGDISGVGHRSTLASSVVATGAESVFGLCPGNQRQFGGERNEEKRNRHRSQF
ncbi:MAG: hypothetical protein GX575_15120 [Candidatus Anammoximicrobium sp.]|nr:hypothetical protein [Candidatus Anammoximicrobium sp.]